MPISGLMDFLPIWGLFGAALVVVWLSIEAGHRLGKYRSRTSKDEKEPPVGAIVGATLGLLAFILAFTFGIAASRHDAKRKIVVQEANAIGTAYLRAGLIPEVSGKKVRKLLAEFVDARLEVVRTGDIEKALERSDAIHRELWKEAESVGREHPDSIVVGLFLQSLNAAIDIHSERVFVAIQSRLPGVFWTVLIIVTVLTMAGVGYYEGLANSKRTLALVVLVITFSAIISLVADLDRPQEGFLTVSQQALIDLRNMMNTMGRP